MKKKKKDLLGRSKALLNNLSDAELEKRVPGLNQFLNKLFNNKRSPIAAEDNSGRNQSVNPEHETIRSNNQASGYPISSKYMNNSGRTNNGSGRNRLFLIVSALFALVSFVWLGITIHKHPRPKIIKMPSSLEKQINADPLLEFQTISLAKYVFRGTPESAAENLQRGQVWYFIAEGKFLLDWNALDITPKKAKNDTIVYVKIRDGYKTPIRLETDIKKSIKVDGYISHGIIPAQVDSIANTVGELAGTAASFYGCVVGGKVGHELGGLTHFQALGTLLGATTTGVASYKVASHKAALFTSKFIYKLKGEKANNYSVSDDQQFISDAEKVITLELLESKVGAGKSDSDNKLLFDVYKEEIKNALASVLEKHGFKKCLIFEK